MLYKAEANNNIRGYFGEKKKSQKKLKTKKINDNKETNKPITMKT